MITDKERREVANKLRERTKHKLAKGESMQHMFSETLGVYRTYDYGAFGMVKESETWKNIVNLLADLIDPGVCHNVYDENEMGACENGFECSVCGCVVEDCEGYYVKGEWNRCPKCGRMVADD